MNKKIQSHIQMPKLVLKQFQNENKELFYYDFISKRVKKGHAKSLYTEKGYYSWPVEQFLSWKIETPLGKLVKFLCKTEFQDGDKPPEGYQEIAFDYLYSLLARAPKMLEEINQNSVFYQFMSQLDQHDVAAHDTFIIAKKEQILGEYTVAFLKNKSKEQLVLPTGGIVQYGKILICPISPYNAIVFDDKDLNFNNHDVNKNYVAVYEMISEEEIHKINLAAVVQENLHNRKYVVGTNKEVLEKLILEVIKESVC